VSDHFRAFHDAYEDRFAATYGDWRPVVREVASPAGDRDAYMVNIDAETGRTRSQPMPLSKNPGEDYFSPQFSLDGKYVAMTTRPSNGPRAVLIRSLSGDEVRRFPLANVRHAYGAQWIPGSQALAVSVFDSSGSQNLVRLDLVTGAQSMLVKQGGVAPVAFSPDGRTVYYAPHAKTDPVAPRIVARELASGAERAVYSAPRGSSVLASMVSRDGTTLIVGLVHTLREHPYKILAVSIATGAVRDLSAAVSGADTANGGQRALGFNADLTAQILLAPKLNAAHTLTMWRVPLAGGAATELGPAPKGIEFNNRQTAGSWLSPDATRLVYVGGSLQTELWVIDEPAVRAELATRR
jgi:dipeptidyl aminopeptidase/acylaminoacyl peptidase